MAEHVQEIQRATVPLGIEDKLVEMSGEQFALMLAAVINKHFDNRLGADNVNHLAHRLIEAGVSWTEARILGERLMKGRADDPPGGLSGDD